ncbi:DUF262 domain-containing protein [Lysinibacillus fusiformis]|uniref:DUF262 domain-containing protein n=1 Tax=Lysinibacillus fusiformis TaxID=28031 RepID=UPI003D03CBE7
MSLEVQINKNKNNITTTDYSMSIGEIVNLYKDKDIDIFPQYQRYFRWNIKQKSNLIESILLGIPIPPIFVSQDNDGKWDLIDGLQRLSSILEFIGVLRKDTDELYEPSVLAETQFLPALKGMQWEELSESIRRTFKRSKLSFIIVDSTVNPKAKYEMFQRLNTNNSELKAQEIRNCLMVMINPDFFNLVTTLAEDSSYKSITQKLTDKQLDEQFDKELIVRFLVALSNNFEGLDVQQEISEFFTNQLVSLMEVNTLNFTEVEKQFKTTAKLLNETLGEDTFRKYNIEEERFEGPFSSSLFEAIFIGVYENTSITKESLEQKIKTIPNNPSYVQATLRGKKPLSRFKELTLLSREIFNEN